MGVTAQDLYARQEFRKQAEKDRPLDHWRAKSWAQRALLSCWLLFRDLIEVYWHAANSGGKTSGGAVLALALLQRREVVDGIRLPKMPEVVYGVLLVHSYKQAVLSSIKALREMMGSWEHHEVPASDDCPGVIYVRPIGCESNDRSKWSRLLVFPRDGEIPDGLRLHFAWADEPPDEKMWRELRFRGISGQRFLRFITATPKLKRFWGWLLKDFEKSCGKDPGREDTWRETVKGARLRIQSSIYDNRALTAADIVRAEQDAANDPEKDARLYGDHVDSTGSRPWPYEILMRWKTRCREPENVRLVVQEMEHRGPGRGQQEVAVNLQVWGEYDRMDTYIVFCDPAKGIRDGEHDPDGLQVWSVRRNALVARANEYIGAFLLGKLAAMVARRYGNALVEPFVTGGFGTGVLAGLEVAEYTNISRDRRADRVGAEMSDQLGYTESEASHNEMSEAILRAMLTDSCGLWSAEVVDCLMACVRDEKGKIVAEVGGHARFRRPEDFVLMGRAQVVVGRIKAGEPLVEVPKLNFNEAVARSMGRVVDDVPHPAVVMEDW